MKNHKYTPKVEIHKADDWTRRMFLNRASVALAALGVPWLPRMEILEKVSRRILGSSTAYAAGSGTYLITIGARNGYPTNHAFPLAEYAINSHVKANYHAIPAQTTVVAATGSMKQDLNLSPQAVAGIAAGAGAGGVDQATFAQKAARLTAVKTNGQGHSNMFNAMWMTGGNHGSGSSFVTSHAEAMAKTNPKILGNPIVYGNRTEVDFGVGVAAAQYLPTYVGSTTELQGLFKPSDITASDNTKLSSKLLDGIYAIQTTSNEKHLSKLSSRQGVEALSSGNAKMASLLKQNLSAVLDPRAPGAGGDATTNSYVTALTCNSLGTFQNGAPSKRFSTRASVAEEMAVLLRCLELGITNTVGQVWGTGDWHPDQAGPGTTNQQGVTAAPDGAGTVQAEHGQFIGEFFSRLLGLANTINVDGVSLGSSLKVVLVSEFGRVQNGSPSVGDNGDGGELEALFFGAGLNGGVYGNVAADVNENLSYLKPDLTTGAATTSGQLEVANLVHTIRGFVGGGVDHDAAAAVKLYT